MMDKELREAKKLGCIDDFADDVIHPERWIKDVGSTCWVVAFGDEIAIGLDRDQAVGPYQAVGMELDDLPDVVRGFVFDDDH